MGSSKVTSVVSWVLVVLLALGFLLASVGKLTGAMTQMFIQWGYPVWFVTVIGIFELLGAIGLLIPKLTRLAILGLTIIMLGGVYTHLANGEGLEVIRPGIFLVLLWAVWFLRRYSFSFSSEA
jgi:uncharacterized membrane protein YphA (DoxX/SURF4 family)